MRSPASLRPLVAIPTLCRWQSTKVAHAAVGNNEDFWKKNERLGRPMSPHLTIYSPQMTSVLSITHRLTGASLYGMMAAGGIFMAVAPHDFAYYLDAYKALELHPALPATLKFMIAWPFTYHFSNGIRHLMWDSGRGVDLSTLYQTGYAVLGISIASASLLSAL